MNVRSVRENAIFLAARRHGWTTCLLTGTGLRPFDANYGVELNAIGRDTVLTVNAVEKNYAGDTHSDRLGQENIVTRGQRPELQKSRSRRDDLLNCFGTLETTWIRELDDQRLPRRVLDHGMEVRIC